MSFEQGEDVYTFDFYCDGCNDEANISADDLIDAAKEIRARGWMIVKNSCGEFEHYCPDCRD